MYVGSNEGRRDHYIPMPSLDLWAQLAVDDTRLDSERQLLRQLQTELGADAFATVLAQLIRQAAVESVALEDLLEIRSGESWTIATEAPGWEKVFERQAASNRQMFESHANALQYVRTQSANDVLTEKFIKELQALACEGQETYTVRVPMQDGALGKEERTFIRGVYKEWSNNTFRRDGSTHYFAPPLDVSPEMNAFVQALNSEQFASLHPVIQMAYAHYGLVHIHPFCDGNGRTARVLCSLYSFAEYDVPLLVFSDRKDTYLQALEGVSLNSLAEFVDYVGIRLTDTVSHAVQQLRYQQAQPLESHLEQLTTYIANYTDVTVEAVAKVAERIKNRVAQMLADRVRQVQPQAGNIIKMSIDVSGPIRRDSESFRFAAMDSYNSVIAGSVTLRVERPVDARQSVYVGVGVSGDISVPFPFKIGVGPGGGYANPAVGVVELRYEDCFPSLSTNAEGRLLILVEEAMIDASRRLHEEIERVIRQAGGLKR